MPKDAYLYHVTLSDGTSYDVTTEHHHDDHPEPSFRKHLLDIIKNSISGIASTVITGYVFKGRKK